MTQPDEQASFLPPRRRIKVLWIIKGLGRGGAETLLLHQASACDTAHFEVHCAYVLAEGSDYAARLRAFGVSPHWLGAEPHMAWPARLYNLLRSGGFDVIHIHSPAMGALARVQARLLPRVIRPVIITTEHSTLDAYHPLTRLATRMTESLDDYVIAVSADALYSGRRIDATKSEVLIHGIPLQEYTYDESARASVREQLSIGSEEVVIGTVANFLPAKDYRNLITALAMLHGTGVDFSFVSVGHGPLMESMKQLADEVGLTPKMHFLGLQSNVARILSGLDVFALGSREEGLPIAVMEALACGIPIVATRVCMLPTQLQDLPCAILVEPRNPDQLASALSKVVTDGALRRSMSQAARIESTRFSHVRSTARLEEIYSRLVEASEPKRRGLRGAATKPPIDWSTE